MTLYSDQSIIDVSITILDDDIVEETEFFTVKMTTPYNNVLYGIDEAIVKIEDNDCKYIIHTHIYTTYIHSYVCVYYMHFVYLVFQYRYSYWFQTRINEIIDYIE